MINRNVSDKIIIFTLFIHMILLIFTINNMIFVDNDNVIPCLSSFENVNVPIHDADSSVKIKSENKYKLHSISEYPEISSHPICTVNINDPNDKVVSFSFDDGYNYDNTLKILDILKKNGDLKATFFFCGHAIDSDENYARKENRDNIVKIVYNGGHEIGNHSDSHPNFKKLSEESSEKEIISCNEKIKNITGESPVVFRFPYGSYSEDSLRAVKNLKMYPVNWSIDTLDWNRKSSSESICDKVLRGLSSGGIILMHTNGKHTPEALQNIITRIKDAGYKIVPVSDLITKTY